MANLHVVETADFTYLSNRTGLTDGNLSSHLSKLEQAGYVTVEKTFEARRPRTVYRLSETGREAFDDHRRGLQSILDFAGA